MLFAKGTPSPIGNSKWTRAAVDQLLSIPIISVKVYTWMPSLKRKVAVIWIMIRLSITERQLDFSPLSLK